LAELTDREREILRLVAGGLTNAEIAGRLVISPLTAKTHVSRILGKLGCHDRARLVGCWPHPLTEARHSGTHEPPRWPTVPPPWTLAGPRLP
jgi:DNA-binding CsgD family transcriptional regulator